MSQPRHRWQSKPGSFDALNASRLFPADNPLGIPNLNHTPLSAIPETLVAYRTRIRAQDFDFSRAAVHFFLDDYRFETVWSRPEKALAYLSKFRILLTPDFSLYADWPLAMQQWNVYRSRWCGRYWQELGFQVIPTVSWSIAESFDFCFAGIPQNNVVAVSSVGVDLNNPAELAAFKIGLRKMVGQLIPSTVVSYGPLPDMMHNLSEVIAFETRWKNIHAHQRSI